jgi:hypothetical protein
LTNPSTSVPRSCRLRVSFTFRLRSWRCLSIPSGMTNYDMSANELNDLLLVLSLCRSRSVMEESRTCTSGNGSGMNVIRLGMCERRLGAEPLLGGLCWWWWLYTTGLGVPIGVMQGVGITEAISFRSSSKASIYEITSFCYFTHSSSSLSCM